MFAETEELRISFRLSLPITWLNDVRKTSLTLFESGVIAKLRERSVSVIEVSYPRRLQCHCLCCFFVDMRSYVKEVIMNLVTVHAQVSAQSPQIWSYVINR